MGAKSDTDELNAMMVRAVGDLLGIKLPTEGMVHCPLQGHEDSTPSFQVRRGGHRWICYGFNQSGGAIDLVKCFYRVPFSEARRWLAAQTGVKVSRSAYPRASARYKLRDVTLTPADKPQAETETPPDHFLYAALLERAPLLQVGAEYLRSRGMRDAVTARFRVGQMPGERVLKYLLQEFGFSRVEKSGLLTKSSTPERHRAILPEGALLIPYIEMGHITYFQTRSFDDNIKQGRWRNLNYRQRRLYNADVLTKPQSERVAICEGAMDVISAAHLGHEAIGLIGTTATLSPAEIILLRGRQVDILMDWDPPGERRAATLRKELARFGVAATRKLVPPSGAKDVNDYLRKGHSRL